MEVKFKTVILECKDIPQLLSFYTGLLHWPVVYSEKNFVRIQPEQGEVGIAFQFDEDYIPPVWPSQPGKQQMMAHLDFAVEDQAERKQAMEKALKLGAEIADAQYGGESWVTMIDPAGHPFCFVIWD